jgi:hypothetical protein
VGVEKTRFGGVEKVGVLSVVVTTGRVLDVSTDGLGGGGIIAFAGGLDRPFSGVACGRIGRAGL